MREVVIASYLRTAQSRSRPKDPSRDVFHKLRADELLAQLLPEVTKRAKVDKEEVDMFYVGSALGVSEQHTIGGRTPIFLANLSEKTPARFIDQQCGSAMAATHLGMMEIATGNADVVLCGGMEHMTRVAMDGGHTAPNPRLFTDEFEQWDMKTGLYMGYTAEKLAGMNGVSREDMDKWGVRSHQRAAAAQESGFFNDEILPVQAEQADGSVMTVETDQAVRGSTDYEGTSQLKPAFKEDGTITAGNSSPLNAGATSMVLMAKDVAEKKGIKPLATIRSVASAGVAPNIMGSGPVPASKKALERAGLQASDIDFWEINEAFSIVALYAINELGLDPEKVNVHGGGIAIGHPLGATGIRILGTLARILEEKGGRYGCATACIGGGQGIATIIEREG